MKITNPFRPERRPKSRSEWQAAIDVANLLMLIDHGRTWGLIDDAGKINLQLCEDFLARGNELSLQPRTPGPGGPGITR